MSMRRISGLLVPVGASVLMVLGLGPSSAAPEPSAKAVDAPGVVAANPAARRPFKGIRYFHVPSQNRYRAVEFSPARYGPVGFLAWAFSSGKGGDSCFNGRKLTEKYYGKVYVVRTDRSYRAVYSVDDLLLGRPTNNPPAWFKKRARQQHDSTGFCSFGFAWPSW